MPELDGCREVPLNKINCVVYPPPSTICGKNKSSEVGDADSSTGPVVVIRNSCLSLVRVRKPTTETLADVVLMRSTPLNGLVRDGNRSLRNFAVWPEPGIVVVTEVTPDT